MYVCMYVYIYIYIYTYIVDAGYLGLRGGLVPPPHARAARGNIMYTYIYIYIHMCICALVGPKLRPDRRRNALR